MGVKASAGRLGDMGGSGRQLDDLVTWGTVKASAGRLGDMGDGQGVSWTTW